MAREDREVAGLRCVARVCVAPVGVEAWLPRVALCMCRVVRRVSVCVFVLCVFGRDAIARQIVC